MEEEDSTDGNPTELFCGRVMHVLDPQNFWVQIGTQDSFDNFSDLEDLFEEFCEEVGRFSAAESIEEGCYVLVSVTSTAGTAKCKRAQVARTNREKGTMDVFYLDYGNTEIVPTNRLCLAVPSYFFAVNLELMKCGLAGIRPIAKTWTGRGIKCFERLTKEKILQAAIISFQPLQMLYEISLYAQADEHKSITHLLLEEEIGMPTDTLENIPEFARDVTQALPNSYHEWYDKVVQAEQEKDDKTFSEDENKVDRTVKQTSSPMPIPDNSSIHAASTDDEAPSQGANKALDSLKVSPKMSFHINDGDLVENACPESPGTPSPGITIPGFDLSEIFKTTMASADTLEKKKDDERRKETKRELQRNIEIVNEDVPEPSTTATWEMTDLKIGKEITHRYDGTISDKIAQIEEVTGSLVEMTKPSPIIPAKKTDANLTAAVTESVNQIEDSSGIENNFPALACWTDSSAEDKPTDLSDEDNSEDDSDYENKLVEQMTEIELYDFSKKLENILLQNLNSDAMTVCEEFHSVVLLDHERQPLGLPAVLDVLIEYAVKNPSRHELALSVLDSYSDCANFGNCLEKVLKESHTRFIRVPPGRSLGYHSAFSQVLGQIFLYSRLWNSRQSDVIQLYLIATFEKWIIFNKNNTQMSQRTKRLMDVYDDCMEMFWNVAGDVVHEVSPTRYVSMQAEIRDKILCEHIDRNMRQRYLVLLLSMQQPGVTMDLSKPTTIDSYTQTETSTSSVLVQTEQELTPHLIPYIIPNIKTSRLSDQWSGSPSVPVNVAKSPSLTSPPFTSPPFTSSSSMSLTDDLSRYRTWAQCVTTGRSDSSPQNKTNQLKNLALTKLGSVKKNHCSREIPSRFIKNHLRQDDAGINGSWRKHSGDGDCLISMAGASNVEETSEKIDWYEGGHTALDSLLDSPGSKSYAQDNANSVVRRRYDSSPQILTTSLDMETNLSSASNSRSSPASRSPPTVTHSSRSPVVNELSKQLVGVCGDSVSEKHDENDSNLCTSPVSPLVRYTPPHSRKKSASPFLKDAKLSKPETTLSEQYLKKDLLSSAVNGTSESRSRSQSPQLHSAGVITKLESVKSIDSVSEKYVPHRQRRASKKETSSVPLKKKSDLIDWWEAGDSFQVSNNPDENSSSRKPFSVSQEDNQSPQNKVTNTTESLSSIVQDVFGGGGESKKASLLEEHSEPVSVFNMSDDDLESWMMLQQATNLPDKERNDIQRDSDVHEAETSPDTTNFMPVRQTNYSAGHPTPELKPFPQTNYYGALGFDDDFDDDNNFVLDLDDGDYSVESLGRGDGLPSSSQVMPSESPRKAVRSYNWVPGKRRCTMCGSHEHVVYSCPQRAKRQIIN